MTEPYDLSQRAAEAIVELAQADMEARGHGPTLAPLQTLLEGVAQLLEQGVLPHVAGRPFNAASEAVELVRAIAKAPALAVDDQVPDYCEEAGCQNRRAGPADLCTSHLIEFAIGRTVLR